MGMRLLRFLVGLALVPCAVAVTKTLVSVLTTAGSATDEMLPLPMLAFGGGFILWMLIFLAMPQTARSYVLAHELTHALWAKLFGKKVLGMRVGAESGAVTVSGTNMWITLAPYFFPLYSVLAVAVYCLVGLFTDVEPWHTPWLALVGFSWAFHVTFTLSTLMTHQSDIHSYGWLFSYTFIYLMNVITVTIWTVSVSEVTFAQAGEFLGHDMVVVWAGICHGLTQTVQTVHEFVREATQ